MYDRLYSRERKVSGEDLFERVFNHVYSCDCFKSPQSGAVQRRK